MWYEVNVARHGQHLFATHPRSLRDSDKALEVFHELRQAFPDCQVTLTRHETSSFEVSDK